MPLLALTSFSIAVIAAVLGIGGLASPAGTLAELLFLLFAALFVVAVLRGEPAAEPRRDASRRTPWPG